MRVTVKLFAAARQLADQQEVALEVPSGATVGKMRELLQKEVPALGSLLPHAMFAVDEEYVTDEVCLSANTEIACIPPVSGG